MADEQSKLQADSILALAPPFMQTGNNARVLVTIGYALDGLLEKMDQAVRARMPGIGTPSALPLIGDDRVLSQGPAETNAAFARRCTTAFETWQRAGSSRAVLGQAMTYMIGYQAVAAGQVPRAATVKVTPGVSANWRWYYNTNSIENAPNYRLVTPLNFSWDASDAAWRVFLILYFEAGATIGAAPKWGSGIKWGNTANSWGLNCTPSVLQLLRSLVRLWKGGNAFYHWIIIAFNGGVGGVGDEFSPNSAQGAGNPDGTWGSWSKNVNGVMVPARSANARYCDGVWSSGGCSIPSGSE